MSSIIVYTYMSNTYINHHTNCLKMCNGPCHEAIDKYNNKPTIRMRYCCNLFALFE
jgi:hypothetical protein